MAGCDVVAKYNSADVHMTPAALNGKLTILENAVVAEVLLASEKRASGVRYLGRETRREGQVKARAVVVSCACIQSVALLLMSRSPRYPTGLANSSGELGQNYIPHFTASLNGFARELVGTRTVNDEGALDHAYIPSYMHLRKRDYARSFGIQFNYQNRRVVPWARSVAGFGSGLKDRIRSLYPAFIHFAPYGEMLPSAGSSIDLDPAAADRFGLPKARVHVRYGENERKLFAAMRAAAREIMEAGGIEVAADAPEPATNHEMGGCRMGSDPRTSVVDRFCRTHDVENLYVVDGSVFPSASEKNPTLTIMALAARTADAIAERFRRGAL
jgi:choline dehydrogenase-like flavoprotein